MGLSFVGRKKVTFVFSTILVYTSGKKLSCSSALRYLLSITKMSCGRTRRRTQPEVYRMEQLGGIWW